MELSKSEPSEKPSLWNKIKHNHLLMMIICCVVPIALILAAANIWGFGSRKIFWLFLILCPLMHYLMMKEFHKKDHKKDGPAQGKCH